VKTIAFIVKLSCLLSIFSLGSCARWNSSLPERSMAEARRELDARIKSKAEPSILFVGNSYSFGMPKELMKVAAQHGKTLRIGHATYGGWTLSKQAANKATLKKIREGHWDVVVIQEQSIIPSLPTWQRNFKMFPPLQELATEARQSGAIPVLYQTWGRRDGNPQVRGDDFFAMTGRIRKGYSAASAAMGNLVIVPAGDDWEKAARAGKKKELFLDDGSHPSEIGNEITAHTFYRTLFGS